MDRWIDGGREGGMDGGMERWMEGGMDGSGRFITDGKMIGTHIVT